MTAAPSYTIEFFSRKRRGAAALTYYFRIREENGKVVVPSQGYSRAVDRNKVAFNLRANLGSALAVDLDHPEQEPV